ncbi:peptidase M13 [Cryobacterium sp. TMT1-21]|uniref:M13 family metallopeptidase n=1 Tax=unclassified Cryobacterium TaxID=2649013 RepID=UPI00106CF812|nr:MULTISPECIES: M13-type metalloendopeptidase [unclassified Cryobacterium]TFC87606.1 peptidase M13 [Cryobacterium sp. TmT2-59]TFD07356.1 peptidase M13 [Cryobacterium sp. TMT1-21]TFD15628.1 peptidase M13 [Cryobacterium sp. TMT2-23]TFD16452.1 peptidase M13 [Cryobacterium sp. TMT4-10]TFD38570.1 peptidase M13 [Cryobacterium sp. TMT2-10]
MTDLVTASGIDIDELDPALRPQDDLFRHVNGKWIARAEIPADKARWGSFYLLAEESEKAVRVIILDAQSAVPGTEERKLGDLYASFMDEERVERLGATPLAADLATIDGITSIHALLGTLGRFERAGVSGAFQLHVDNDPGDPERYLVFVEQAGLGLPDESYYRDEKSAAIREAYQAFLARMLGLAGLADAAGRAERVFALETELATHHWDKVRCRDSEKTYNLKTWGQVTALAAGADLQLWLEGLDAPANAFDEVVVRQPSFVTGLAEMLTEDRIEAWQDWLRWQVIRSSAAFLSSDFVEASFDFYGRTLTGTPQLRDRWKRGVSLVEGALGEAVGRIYVERHFKPSAKASMDVLVANLVEAYRQSIIQLDWMTEETRTRALEKLELFTPKIGYPVKWRDYSSLPVSADDLLANVHATNEFEFQRELGKIGNPLDRDEWFMTPQTINAYYNPGFNEIVFPAAILQPPFFDDARDAAANYGAIGAVIGHEIGHGFDDQGSKYDGTGLLIDWWTEDDRIAFEQRTSSLIEQFNELAPRQVPDHHVNGALTVGENIGDLGGLSIAWKAYLLSLDGQEPPVIDGFTGAQRFFLSWAQAWQLKMRDEEAIRLLSIDPHSPNEFRCNQIVRNIEAFYTAFDVTPEDELWLAPEKRVTIW